MKKFKILFILIIFMFIGIFEVKAIDCVQMPGVNNTYYIPKNGSAYCYYRPLEGEGIGSNPQYKVMLAYDGKTQSSVITMIGEKENDQIVRINSDYTFLDLENDVLNWDGYRLEKNNGSAYFTSNVLVDYENIDGCPQYVYWIVNASNRDRIVGISGKFPTITYDTSSETNGYAIYEYVEDGNSYIDDPDSDEYPQYYFADMEESESYSNFLKTCSNNEKSDYEKGGYSSYTGGINDRTEETLATCKYYFGLQYTDTSCNAEEVTLIYKYIKEFDKNKNKYSYNMDVKIDNSNIDIYEIQNNLKSKPLQDKSNLDDLITEMYTNEFVKDTISQYITYNDGKWECADTLYISTTGTSKKHVLQGKETGVTSGNFYSEANAVFKSTKEKSTACDYYFKEEPDTKPEKPSTEKTYECLDHSNDVACGSVYNIPRELPQLTSLFFNIIKIMAPIALIIKALIDLLKGMAASKEDEIIKARSKIFKRLVPALTIFFLIMILQVVFGIIGTNEEASTFNKCATCFLSNNCEGNYFDSEAYCYYLQHVPTDVESSTYVKYSSGSSKNTYTKLEHSNAMASSTNATSTATRTLSVYAQDPAICDEIDVFGSKSVDSYQKELNTILKNAGDKRAKTVAAAKYLADNFEHLPYYWGGHSSSISKKWGKCTEMTLDNKLQTVGKDYAYGLDCSGYVSFALINSKTISLYMDSGSLKKLGKSIPITSSNIINNSEVKPGDLVWHEGHIGIIIDKDSNGYIVAHEKGRTYGLVKEYLHKMTVGKFTHFIIMDSKYI